MSLTGDRCERLQFDADVRVEYAGRHAQLRAWDKTVDVEVPNVVTGLVLYWHALPRGLRYELLGISTLLGLHLRFSVRDRVVLERYGERFHFRPLALLLAILGQ